MDIIKAAEKWVKENYDGSKHLLRTGYWLKKLSPKADLASIIAAITHDIERAFKKDRVPPLPEFGIKWSNPTYNKWHGERSASFVEKFLLEKGIKDQKLISEVKRLIRAHEYGEDTKSDLVKDADSISFLEVNAPLFISWIPEKFSREEVKEKFDWMFKRISTPKAKALAKPFYEKALRMLDKISL